jgi:hypothetical protein
MQITIDIPDKLYHTVETINKNIESSIVNALELYAERQRLLKNDPLYKWFNTPVEDKDGCTDVSENHDKYIYKI